MKLLLVRNVLPAALVTVALAASVPTAVRAGPPSWAGASETARTKTPGADAAEKTETKKGEKDKKKAKSAKESGKKKSGEKKEKTAGDTGGPDKTDGPGGRKTIDWSGGCSPDAVAGATACEGIFTRAGQPDADDLNELEVFDISDWAHLAKVDDKTVTAEGALTVTGIGSAHGMWSFEHSDHVSYMAVLKGGTSFSAFLLGDGSGDNTARKWRITGATTTSGDGPDLSNFALYGSRTPMVVPLPAASWLLIAAIGGLGVARWVRRRRAA